MTSWTNSVLRLYPDPTKKPRQIYSYHNPPPQIKRNRDDRTILGVRRTYGGCPVQSSRREQVDFSLLECMACRLHPAPKDGLLYIKVGCN